jgi:RNA polymerase sigma-70 factor, ECF subfamily
MSGQELYRRYGSLVYRRALRMLGDQQAARDACQEVFLRLLRSLPEFEQASPVTWLYKVTTNHCLNLIRDEQRRRELLAIHVAHAPDTQMPSSLSVLLRGFPEELREIAVYYFVDEMSQEKIAEILGISQRTVCNRLAVFRGLAKSAWVDDSKEVS